MTIEEQRQWAVSLGPTNKIRRDIIKDLLAHASDDDMSKADRAICLSQLTRLEAN